MIIMTWAPFAIVLFHAGLAAAVRPYRAMTRSRLILASAVLALIMGAAFVAYYRFPLRIKRSFPSEGVSSVVLRASAADGVVVAYAPRSGSIRVSGIPSGGARGYHPQSIWWGETPAPRWGMDFVGQRFGSVLVISTRNEIGFMHHHYYLAAITLDVPEGVTVSREVRQLSGDGTPDLRAP